MNKPISQQDKDKTAEAILKNFMCYSNDAQAHYLLPRISANNLFLIKTMMDNNPTNKGLVIDMIEEAIGPQRRFLDSYMAFACNFYDTVALYKD